MTSLIIVLGAGPRLVAPLRHRATVLARPKNPEHRIGEKLFNDLTPQFSTT